MYGPTMRRRFSAIGNAAATPSADPPYCSTGDDARPLYQMLTDLGLYIGPWESDINIALSQSINSFARANGLDISRGIDATFCQALLAAWQGKTSPPQIDPSMIRAAGRRFVAMPGAENGDVVATDPISDCHMAGGTWDPVTMTCGMEGGMSSTTKYLIIGGVLLAVGVAGYGIYAATR